ncbi:FAD-binding protein [Pulveribacter suum]|uniref:FAD-binding dehydrogenase n=1 Tax=Pulveribacter suum TaxID=2116657 RepID=A0A2P1NN61_9BURK|nr:FAD-binding protein [Pulveribacter suum]AVP58490.1 FAD-binding dehydrogenase [Pulveribacter suum]
MAATLQSDVLVAGGGLAGIVTALHCLRAGQRVTLVDRDTPERLGGLALWAFGGMALVGTPLQARMKIPDTPDKALADWVRFGELGPGDGAALQWARRYVERSRADVYEWLLAHGLKFMPAVNWVERGRFGEGNRLPRYHIVWGTARELTRRMIAALREADAGSGRLTLLHRHRVTAIEHAAGRVAGLHVTDEDTGAQQRLQAPVVVLAMGGINGSHERTRAHWPAGRPLPAAMLNGAHPYADGALHQQAAALGGALRNTGEMWNYAAGFPHPQPHFEGHGLSAIPAKSALWLNHRGERIGPEPLVTGFDTHWLCQRVAEQDQPWTWHLLNWRIAAKEFAISGAEHNQRIRDRQFPLFIKETLLGNHRLVRQMQQDSPHFLVDDTLAGLAAKMNQLTGTPHVRPEVLQATADAFDANFAAGGTLRLHDDDQIRRILHARQWGPDKLRTCAPAPLQQKGAGPFIAIHMQLITRKSLGGLATDLQSRVLDGANAAIDGLYCVGEAAGFGGGGASGRRSLEGTFLPGCILTAHAAAASITGRAAP